MKILHVISSLNPEEGGPVENVKQYCANYKLDNIEGEVLCSDGPKDKKKLEYYLLSYFQFCALIL